MYPSDMSDSEWEIIKPLVVESKRGRPREYDIRSVLNGIFYVNRTGCQWRYLPAHYPQWDTCYGYFSRFSKKGIWEKIMDRLRDYARLTEGKSEQPTAAIIDSQTIQTTQARENIGYDAGKKKKAESAI